MSICTQDGSKVKRLMVPADINESASVIPQQPLQISKFNLQLLDSIANTISFRSANQSTPPAPALVSSPVASSYSLLAVSAASALSSSSTCLKAFSWLPVLSGLMECR